MRAALNEAWCYGLLRRVRWSSGVTCPFCQQRRVTVHTKSATTPRRRYLCMGCRRTFTDLTETPFARTNLPLGTWFLCLRLMGQGRSTSELAKQLGVKWDTSRLLQRRLGAAFVRSGLVRQLCEMMERADRG